MNVDVPMDSSSRWDLEIGSGSCEFCISRAVKFPERKIIGIEKTRNKIKKAGSKKSIPPNLWILHTNAVWWVSHFVLENSLDNIFILYPNTYPKNKQANMRWINRPFMGYLLRRLKINGQIEIRTNDFYYYLEVKKKMLELFYFMKYKKHRVLNSSYQPQTAFERKYLRSGVCWSLEFLRC